MSVLAPFVATYNLQCTYTLEHGAEDRAKPGRNPRVYMDLSRRERRDQYSTLVDIPR